MNQTVTGKFIALKRKEKGQTQEQLAEKLGVSNKTISKWETGKCMPDYAIVQSLCKELGISVAELMEGEEAEKQSVQVYDEEQMMDMLRRIQELEKQKCVLSGTMLIVLGIAMLVMSNTLGGSNVKDFFSGLLFGMAVTEMVVGAYVAVKYTVR
jgi:transcriptional regulator with XRE-family HTH domain